MEIKHRIPASTRKGIDTPGVVVHHECGGGVVFGLYANISIKNLGLTSCPHVDERFAAGVALVAFEVEGLGAVEIALGPDGRDVGIDGAVVGDLFIGGFWRTLEDFRFD